MTAPENRKAANGTRVMVCGSRTWDDYQTIHDALAGYVDRGVTIMHGGANGADRLAGIACRWLGLDCYVFPPNYRCHGKNAPHIRNNEMLDQADRVLAFWDGKSRGTASVIEKARMCEIPVEVVRHAD